MTKPRKHIEVDVITDLSDWNKPLTNQLEMKSGKLLVKGTDCAPSFAKWRTDCDVVIIRRSDLIVFRDSAMLHWNRCA